MIKRISTIALSAFVAVLFLASCSKKSNTQGRYIPANAGIVLHINGEAITAKLSWDEIKQNEIFKTMIADTSVSSFTKTLLENPENSGVNIKGDMILFVVKDSMGGYASVEGTIKDEAKFKAMLTNALKNGKETSKDGFTYFADEKTSVAYNKEKFIVSYNTPEVGNMDKAISPTMDMDTTVGIIKEIKTTRDMNAINAGILSLKEDASLAKNERFTGLMAEKGDAHFWYNAQYFSPTAALGGIGAMANLSKLFEDAVTTATVKFDNGKIDLDAKSYGGKEITELYKKYSGTSFDKAMVTNIPSQNLAGLFVFNFKPEGVKEFLKLLNMDGLVNLGAAQAGFNLDDFIKANKGDILIAVTDIKKDSLTEGANFIFAASINDKPSFNKLIDAGKKFGGEMVGANNKYSYNVNDKYFVFTNNKNTTDTYLAGTANTSFSFMDKITGGPFGGFVNFQYILNNMKPKVGDDSLDIEMYNASVKIWDNLLISGGNFKDGGITQHWELNMLDKNTNSLKLLNSYLGTMATIQEKKKIKNNIAWMNEDTIAPMADSAMVVEPKTNAPSNK